MKLHPGDCVLVLIDVQGKLADVMFERDTLFRNLERLVKGLQLLDIPIIWMEQVPEKMGPTIEPLRRLLQGQQPLAKSCFSGADLGAFHERLRGLGRRQTLLAGIEAHVCVYQTAADLLAAKYGVTLVADAVSSRTAGNRDAGIQAIRDRGGQTTTVEMLLFELLRSADHPAFRDMLKIVK